MSLTTSRSERPVDQGGNNETALFFLSLSLADSAALSSTPRESSLSNCCRSRLSTRSISSFFLPNLSLFPPCFLRQAVSVHLIVSSLRSRGLHYTRGPQHTVPMATRSLTIYAVCLLIPFRLDLSNFSSF